MTATAPPIPFRFRPAGVSFRQDAVSRSAVGEPVLVVPDPTNPHDPAAWRVHGADGRHLGFVPAPLAARLTAAFADRAALRGRITDVFGSRLFTVEIAVEEVVAVTEVSGEPLEGWVRPPEVVAHI